MVLTDELKPEMAGYSLFLMDAGVMAIDQDDTASR